MLLFLLLRLWQPSETELLWQSAYDDRIVVEQSTPAIVVAPTLVKFYFNLKRICSVCGRGNNVAVESTTKCGE